MFTQPTKDHTLVKRDGGIDLILMVSDELFMEESAEETPSNGPRANLLIEIEEREELLDALQYTKISPGTKEMCEAEMREAAKRDWQI